MRLALFDLDNTLIAGDSDHAWADFLIERGVLDATRHRASNDAFFADYQAGRLDIQAYLRFALSTLAGRDPLQLAAWRRDYLATRIQPILLPKAKQLVASHADDLSAVVTATNAFLARPIADLFRIPNLIACELEEVDGRFTGRPKGVPSFREGKVTRVEAWLSERSRKLTDFTESYFYTDSANDLALLRRVTHPVAVDPDPVLAGHARSAGWPILSLRDA
jgi:HAD superfamily hydrolase (TIGR01490 family)